MGKKAESFDVVVINPFLHPDIVLYVPPGKRVTSERVLYTDRMEMRIGAGAYTSMMMASLGLKCCCVDKIGSDVFGIYTRREMEAFGLDMRFVTTYPGNQMLVLSYVQEGEGGTMVNFHPPELARTSFDEIRKMLRAAPLAKVLYIYIWFWSFVYSELYREETHKMVKEAKDRGYAVFLDLNYKPSTPPTTHEMTELKKALKHVDVLLPNLYDAEILVGKMPIEESAHHLLALGPKLVAVKAGKQGSYVASDRGGYRSPAYQVNVLDTTGAGDMYGGAFTYGWLRGWEPKRIALFANAAAAYGISHPLNEKYPTVSQVEELISRVARKRM